VARPEQTKAGGARPGRFLTAAGPHPAFAELYGAVEVPPGDAATPTARNVQDADATIWFGETTTADAHATVAACRQSDKPCMLVYPAAAFQPEHVATWIAENQITTLNVAGNCEAEEPGIGDRVERFLGEVLVRLGHKRA
jgi:Circularly permutated YpsA SLOG family